MKHEELLAKINHMWNDDFDYVASCHTNALRAVIKLHTPIENAPHPFIRDGYIGCSCGWISTDAGQFRIPYPCDTIQVIERELA